MLQIQSREHVENPAFFFMYTNTVVCAITQGLELSQCEWV